MIDGNLDTLWVFDGDVYGPIWDGTGTLDKDPIKAGVDLGKSYMVDDINLAFEKGEEKWYFFNVYVYPEDVYKRQEMVCGNNASISINSDEDCGFELIIQIHIKDEEEAYVSDIDSGR